LNEGVGWIDSKIITDIFFDSIRENCIVPWYVTGLEESREIP
jgi:hypothetical protein